MLLGTRNKLCLHRIKAGRRDANASAARAPRARGELAKLRFAGAIWARKQFLSARWRILAKQLTLFRQYPTPAVARGCRAALETSCVYPDKGRPPTKAKRTPAKHPTGAPRRRAQRASYWPSGRENFAKENPGKTPGGRAERHLSGREKRSLSAKRDGSPGIHDAERPVVPDKKA